MELIFLVNQRRLKARIIRFSGLSRRSSYRSVGVFRPINGHFTIIADPPSRPKEGY